MADTPEDDPFAGYARKRVADPHGPAPADDPFARYGRHAPTATKTHDSDAPGLWESFGRGAAEGATLGFDDKLGLDKERREASKRANPWTHFLGEAAGSVVPMVAATLLPTGASQAAAAGRGAQLLTKGAGLVRGALVPGEIASVGQAIGQGTKLGAVYGGLTGPAIPTLTLTTAMQKHCWIERGARLKAR